MTAGDVYRDVVPADPRPSREARDERAYVAVIGIDNWSRYAADPFLPLEPATT